MALNSLKFTYWSIEGNARDDICIPEEQAGN